ncbi:MAG: histidine kinase [Eubacteriales bacterium]|nr:histidine kinase [Eubacteriales bacterium]
MGDREKRVPDSLFKRFLIIVIVMFLCMAGSLALTDQVVRKISRHSMESSNEKILRQIDAKTTEFHNSLYSMLTLLAYEQTAYDYFEQDDRQRIDTYENLTALLSNTTMIRNDIAGISLYDGGGKKLLGVGKDFDVFGRIDLVDKLTYSDVFRPNSSSEVYFMVSYPVFDLMRGNYDRQIGMIILWMRVERFASYLQGTALTEGEHLYLLDSRNVVIAGEREQEFMKLDQSHISSTRDSLVQTVEQRETGWRIVSVIPIDDLYGGATMVRISILIIYLITIAGLSVLLYFCYFLMIRPIRRVDIFVRQSVTDPMARLKMTGTDEISVLAENLDHMLDEKDEMNERLRHAQRELYELELARQQMQVLAYRNQINPHFLYNTFECIRAMALYYEADEIAEITMALSHIFRYAIKGADIVTVEQEIADIREYARIIHYRFGGRIHVEVAVEKGAEEKKIPRLILQPIVENSVFHGLEQKLEDGTVTVSVRRTEENGLELIVQDDGCGMEEEEVSRLLKQMKRHSLSKSAGSSGIGLANIYHRLLLFYGEMNDFTINSSPGKGTQVRIVIWGEAREKEALHV